MEEKEFLRLKQILINAAEELGIPMQMDQMYTHTYNVLSSGYLTTSCPIVQGVKVGSAACKQCPNYLKTLESDNVVVCKKDFAEAVPKAPVEEKPTSDDNYDVRVHNDILIDMVINNTLKQDKPITPETALTLKRLGELKVLLQQTV